MFLKFLAHLHLLLQQQYYNGDRTFTSHVSAISALDISRDYCYAEITEIRREDFKSRSVNLLKHQFHLVIDELLEWDAGEAGVGEDYVGGRLV